MSAIISFHVDASGTVSVSDLDLKMHALFETKLEAVEQMKDVVNEFVKKCNDEKGLVVSDESKGLKEGELQLSSKIPDGFHFSKPEEGEQYAMWVKYSKPGRIYGRTHKAKRIRLFVTIDVPVMIPLAPVAPPVCDILTDKKSKLSPSKGSPDEKQSIEEKRDASYRDMIVELEQKLKERRELNEQKLLALPSSPKTPLSSPVQSRSDDDEEKRRFDAFVEEAIKGLNAFDYIEQNKIDEGWRIFTNPMFGQTLPEPPQLLAELPLAGQKDESTSDVMKAIMAVPNTSFSFSSSPDSPSSSSSSVLSDSSSQDSSSSDEEVYYVPCKRRCISYDADTDGVDSDEWNDSFSSSSSEIYYDVPKRDHQDAEESISYSEFFDENDDDDDTEPLSSFSDSDEEEKYQAECFNFQTTQPSFGSSNFGQSIPEPTPLMQEFFTYAVPHTHNQFVPEYVQEEMPAMYQGYVNPFTDYDASLTTPLLTPEQQMDHYDHFQYDNEVSPSYEPVDYIAYYNSFVTPPYNEQPMPYDDDSSELIDRQYKMLQNAIREWHDYNGRQSIEWWSEMTPIMPSKWRK
jgi:hypothetical protein